MTLQSRLTSLLPWTPEFDSQSDLGDYILKLSGARDCFRYEVDKSFRSGEIDVSQRVSFLDKADERWHKAIRAATRGLNPCR